MRPLASSRRSKSRQEISLGWPSGWSQPHIWHSSMDNLLRPQVGFSAISFFITSISVACNLGLDHHFLSLDDTLPQVLRGVQFFI